MSDMSDLGLFVSKVGYKLTQAGCTYIKSNGTLTRIYRNKSGDILKVFAGDNCYHRFIQLALQNQNNPHFPKIKKAINVKEYPGVSIVKIEELTELNYNLIDELGFKIYIALLMEYDIENYLNIDAETVDKELDKWLAANSSLAKTLLLVYKNKNRCRWDLDSNDNFMLRGDTVVILDPYS